MTEMPPKPIAYQRQVYYKIRGFAREMRKHPTEAEDFFWQRVRNRQAGGLKFNRQVVITCPIDNQFTKYYIADFHCHSLNLIIEIDGAAHNETQDADLLRTEQMEALGFRVIRFTNEEVLGNWEKVVREIVSTHPDPPFPGGK